jgi:flagellar basal body-associated protein FliL
MTNKNTKNAISYWIDKNRRKKRILIASVSAASIITVGAGIGVGYSIWHSQSENKSIQYFFLTKDSMQNTYHNKYEFDDHLNTTVSNGGVVLNLYFSQMMIYCF